MTVAVPIEASHRAATARERSGEVCELLKRMYLAPNRILHFRDARGKWSGCKRQIDMSEQEIAGRVPIFEEVLDRLLTNGNRRYCDGTAIGISFRLRTTVT